MNGIIIYESSKLKQQTEIDISNYPSGIYLVYIQTEDKFLTYKFVKP